MKNWPRANGNVQDEKVTPELQAVYDSLEAEARDYCAMAKLNPDEEIHRQHPSLAGIFVRVQRWKIHALELYDLDVRTFLLRRRAARILAGSEAVAAVDSGQERCC